jgi:hypothetical protein
MIRVFDDFIPDPAGYRSAGLAGEFRSYRFPEATFHGIRIASLSELPATIAQRFPEAIPTLSFFRKSPAGQVEPHFIHTDADMGDWSAILYLNPEPVAGDGTAFWTHEATGAIESAVPHERSEEGRATDGWALRRMVPAKFNRLLVFRSTLFHSRAIAENWGTGDAARLTQVTFGRRKIL